ncbi:MAG: dienelactone hydrolase family protein [Ilumatobacteraceae bacterium]
MRETLDNGTPIEIVRVEGSTRGLVVAPDIFGLRPLFDDLVARFAAEWGMTTVAVEPFPTESMGPEIEPRFEAVARLDDARVIGDLVAAAVATGCEEVGLIGFCLGGMHCFKAADAGRFDRIASFYGMIRLPEAWNGPGQSEPLPHVAANPSPLLAVIGDLDPYTPSDAVAELQATGAQVIRYADAEHGFAHDSSRPAHRADDAADAFARSKAWLSGL